MGCDAKKSYNREAGKFQSTHPHGVRPSVTKSFVTGTLFQSTHPHGVRPIKRQGGNSSKRFQSTHPHGVRLPAAAAARRGEVSIHAPAWGATNGRFDCLFYDEFQSTHPHGVRPAYDVKFLLWLQFQSTHPHGVRRGVINHH